MYLAPASGHPGSVDSPQRSPAPRPPARRLGRFGGSFDPVPQGQRHPARAAREGVRHDRGVLLPAPRPPPKPAPARTATAPPAPADTIRRTAPLTQAFIPDASAKILDQLAIPEDVRSLGHLDEAGALRPGTPLPPPVGVLPRLSVETVGAGR
jgi:hypothetical protein